MTRTLKKLQIVQGALLLSVLLYVAVAEIVNPHTGRVDPTLSYLFSTLSVGIVGTIFVVRRTLVLRAAASLGTRPDDVLSLSHWQTGYIATYALCEALALLGLVLRMRGSGLPQSLLFYIGGFVLLLFFRPRPPVANSST